MVACPGHSLPLHLLRLGAWPLTSAAVVSPQRPQSHPGGLTGSAACPVDTGPAQCFTAGCTPLYPRNLVPHTASSLSPQTHSQDIEKLKSQYRALARDSAQARRKYQEASKGTWLSTPGQRERASTSIPSQPWPVRRCPGNSGASQASVRSPPPVSPPLPDKDRDKAKDKYVRSLWKLFAHHNRYVLGVRAAQLHHQHHHQLMLPSLLQSLQDLHQEMASIL